MTLEEFNKERDERALKTWKDAWNVWRAKKSAPAADEWVTGFLLQWAIKEIASCQMMIEELVRHTKLPKLDEILKEKT